MQVGATYPTKEKGNKGTEHYYDRLPSGSILAADVPLCTRVDRDVSHM